LARSDFDAIDFRTSLTSQKGPLNFTRSFFSQRCAVARDLNFYFRQNWVMPLHFGDQSFRALLSSMPQIVFISNNEGETLFLNQKWYEYTGNQPDDIKFESWKRVIHPDDVEALLLGWDQVQNNQQTWTQEYRLRRHDGVYQWHLGRSVPDFDEKGRVIRWIGTVTDIETQKKAEKALLEINENLEQKVLQRTKELIQANSFLDTVIENIPNMIFVKEAENLKFVRFNRAGEELIGVSRKQLIGKNDFDLFPESEALAFQEKDRAVIAGQVMVDIPEEPITTKSGQRILHTKKLPVYDSNGVPRYLMGISEDITEKIKIEEERLQFIEDQIEKKESQKTTERFRFLSEASALLGSTLDYEVLLKNLTQLTVPAIADWCSIDLLQPDRKLKQIMVAHQNPEKIKWARKLRAKYPPKEQVSTGPMHVIRTGKSELVVESDRASMESISVDREHLDEIQSLGLRSIIYAPIRSRGQVVGVLSLYTTAESMRTYSQADLHLAEDIAERAGVAVENAQLYKEASHLNRVKDEFLATLSHELRTPLNVILGHAEILHTEQEELTPEQIKMSIDAIFRNAKTQTGLIDDLLDVSSIITGKVSYKPTEVIPVEIFTNIIKSLKTTAIAKGIELISDLSQAPKIVYADATRLHQIVWNLISNAIKFTPHAGQVKVSISTHDSDWEIEVTDTGRGIDPDFLPYVFDRFRQEDSSTTRHYGGLGLGLSIVRHLTELHGGSVHAVSQGKELGSTFKVTLPLNKAVLQNEVIAKKNESSLSDVQRKNGYTLQNIKILLIEDSEDSRFLIRLILNRAGAQTIEAVSAEEARQKLQNFYPDLILSDVGMADESGVEFMQKLKRDPKFKNIPAIALTAYVRVDEKEAVLKAGFLSHVGKPINTENLLSEIQKVLKKPLGPI
jgi:PAS domain S-box-containing protein